MKKYSLLFFSLLASFNLFSQISKNDIIVSLDGNYRKTTIEYGVLSNINQNQINALSISPSGGVFLTDRIFIGLGLDYNRNKEIRINKLEFNSFRQYENLTVTSNAFLPRLIVGYYLPVFHRLYFNTNFSINIGKINSQINRILIEDSKPINNLDIFDTPMIPKYYEQEYQTKSDYFGTRICPELTYILSPKFALNLGLGRVEYSIIDWKNDNSSWLINFNPECWRLGVTLKL